MKLYLGVDLHKKSCWVTTMNGAGQVLRSQRLSTERNELLGYFGRVGKPAAVAVEATFNWYYFLDLIEPLGLELHLVHPWKTRAIASARIKHDKLDSRILAELLRTWFRRHVERGRANLFASIGETRAHRGKKSEDQGRAWR